MYIYIYIYIYIYRKVRLVKPTHDSLKEMLYEVRCLKSNEDMILALAGQIKTRTHDLCGPCPIYMCSLH